MQCDECCYYKNGNCTNSFVLDDAEELPAEGECPEFCGKEAQEIKAEKG